MRARDVMVNLFFKTIRSDDTLDKKNDDRHSCTIEYSKMGFL